MNKEKTIPICFATDENYVEPCMVAITSLLSNAKGVPLNIYILDGGITSKSKIKLLKISNFFKVTVSFIKFEDKLLEKFYLPGNHFNKINYYRLMLPSLIKNFDKLIYLDCDLIVKKNILELFKIDISKYYLAGAEGQFTTSNKLRLGIPKKSCYINSGVLLINAKKWRHNKISEKILQYIQKTPHDKLINVDQDAINSYFSKNEDIKYISQNWNVEFRTDRVSSKQYKNLSKNPYIIHYLSSDKPWHKGTKQDTKYYFEYKKILIDILKNKKTNNCKLVTFFSHSSQLGGSEKSMIELITELKEKNIFPHIILPNNGPLEVILNELNIPFDVLGLNWWAAQEIKDFNSVVQNNKDVLENFLNYLPELSLINPDLIYSNTIVSPWGAIAANYLKKPHLWHVREYGDLDHNFNFISSYDEIINFIEKYSDQIIVNSKSVAGHLVKHLKEKKPVVAYNYIDIDKKLLRETNDKPIKQKNSLKVLVAATIHEGKNQLEAIKVIKNLISSGVDIELLLLGGVGDENYLNTLKKYIKKHNLNNRIHFQGFVNNPYPYFLESDVVLVTSFKEAYGRTAVEGMLLKKPVIVTKEGGSNEIVNDGKTGFSYHVGDLKTLEEILMKLTSKTVREKIANRAYKSIKQINNKENYGYKIAKIIKQTIKDYQPRNKLTNIVINVFEKNLKELSQIQQELNKISSSLEKKKSLEKEINQIKNEIDNLESDLNKIQSAKFFKLWQGYNKLKKLI